MISTSSKEFFVISKPPITQRISHANTPYCSGCKPCQYLLSTDPGRVILPDPGVAGCSLKMLLWLRALGFDPGGWGNNAPGGQPAREKTIHFNIQAYFTDLKNSMLVVAIVTSLKIFTEWKVLATSQTELILASRVILVLIRKFANTSDGVNRSR